MAKMIMETEEDLALVKDWIMLPIVMDVLERDMRQFSVVELKMQPVYIQILKTLQHIVGCEIYEKKFQLRERGIRVIEQKRTSLGVDAEYLCRGYTRHMSLLWSLVKSEVQIKLCGYAGISLTDKTR